MLLFRYSFESCIRNKKKAVLNLMICMITVILVNVFTGNFISVRDQLERLPDVIKVNAVISNLCGNMDSGLKIKESYMDGVINSPYITDPAFSIQLKSGFGKFGANDFKGKLRYFVTGSNSIASIPGLKKEELKFADSTNANEFFNSDSRVCIMESKLLEDQKLSVGDEITLTTFYYRFGDYHDIYLEPLESGSFTIVGTMDIKEYLGESVQPNIIVPFETVRNMYHARQFDFFANSGSFQVKDPYKLNELKEEMHKIGYLPVIFRAEFQYDGNALTIRDDTFVNSAEQLIKSQRLFTGILPLLCAAVLCVGFVMAELLMKSRISEYAIMRSLGQSHKESFRSLVIEYGMSALAGCFIGVVAGIFLLNTLWIAAVAAAALFFVCYIVGTMAALSSLRKLGIMKVLSRND